MPLPAAIHTVLRNTSGAAKYFGFLPPHGRTLAADQHVVIPGDILSYFVRNGRVNKRQYDAFEAAVESGELQIVKTPAPIILDPSGEPLALQASSANVLTASAAPWQASAGLTRAGDSASL